MSAGPHGGWKSVELREVGKIVTGSTPPKARQDYYGGNFPFVKPGELLNCPVSDSVDKLSDAGSEVADVAPAGGILVSCIGNLGKTGLATCPVAFNQQINAVIPHRIENSKWIFYAVQSNDFVSQLAAVSSATTISIVNKRKFSALRIPITHDYEQQRIVAEIEKQFTRLEAGVAALKRAQANLKRYRAAVLKAACEGKLVPTEAEFACAEGRAYESGEQLLQRILVERREKWRGRGKYQPPIDIDTNSLPTMPDGWVWSSLDMLIVSGPQNGVYLPRTLYGQGHPILRIDDYQNGWVRPINDLNKVTADKDTIDTYCLQTDDLVINRVNSLTHLGKCLVVRQSLANALFESNMMRSVLASDIDKKYLELYLRSKEGRARLISGAKWAVNQASINQQDVKKAMVPLPPLAEQTRIVAEVERRLSVVDEMEAMVATNLQRAARLR